MNWKLLLLAFVLVFATAGISAAGTFDPGNSVLRIKIGTIPSMDVPATGGSVTLTDDGGSGHILYEAASVFSTVSRQVPSAAFTGFPNLTALKLTFHAQTGTFSDGFSTPNSVGNGVISGFGGTESNSGQAVLLAVQGAVTITIPLSGVGNGGTTTVGPVLNNSVVLEGEPFGTNDIQITGISTNLLFVPTRGNILGVAFTLNLTTVELIKAIEVTVNGIVQEVQTVTIENGTNNLASASQAGSVTLVSPIRLDTGSLSGRSPALLMKKFTFVPEPGTVLLLVSGAVGLAVIGRRRMK